MSWCHASPWGREETDGFAERERVVSLRIMNALRREKWMKALFVTLLDDGPDLDATCSLPGVPELSNIVSSDSII